MVTIGSTDEPGTITTLESAASSGVNITAPGDVVIVGQADLSNGNASANSVKRITRPNQARNEFGPTDSSPLTKAIQDAIIMGAWPVFAIATERTSVTGEDLSGASGQTGTLANAPVVEDADSISFTINSTSKDTVLVWDEDPADSTPGTDEVLVNPVSGKYNIDEAAGNTGDDVDYDHFDYPSAFEAVKTEKNPVNANEYIREVVDGVYSVSENSSVVSDLDTTVDEMEQEGWFVIGHAGAGEPYIGDISTYTQSYDNSRIQLIYPSRDGDGETIIGSFAGLRASLGIDEYPIFKRLDNETDLQFNLDDSERTSLINAKVVPLKEEGAGAKIMEDLTTVKDDNTDEQAWTEAFARLVTDYVAELSNEIAEPFIGRLNRRGARNQLGSKLSGELKSLLNSHQIDGYALVVQEDTATKVDVDVGISVTDPIKNIETTITAGEVQRGTE